MAGGGLTRRHIQWRCARAMRGQASVARGINVVSGVWRSGVHESQYGVINQRIENAISGVA